MTCSKEYWVSWQTKTPETEMEMSTKLILVDEDPRTDLTQMHNDEYNSEASFEQHVHPCKHFGRSRSIVVRRHDDESNAETEEHYQIDDSHHATRTKHPGA
jgi:hypothetical protein